MLPHRRRGGGEKIGADADMGNFDRERTGSLVEWLLFLSKGRSSPEGSGWRSCLNGGW